MKTKLLFLLSGFICLNVFAQTQIGNDINGSVSGEFFGQSISLSSDGTRIVIGAHFNPVSGPYSGKVKVFDFDGTSWAQAGSDINSTGSYEYFGFSTTISSDGNRIALGGYGNAGYVSIYDWNGTNWIQVGSNITGEAVGDYSGYSIDLSSNGNRIAIGAIRNDGNGGDSGHVKIYNWNGSSWVQLGNNINGEFGGDQSGNAVAISSDGNRVVIGASYNDGTATYAGHARVYDWNGSDWIQVGIDLDGEAGNDSFGYAVDLSGDGHRVAIGGWYNDGNGADSGHVRVFDWNGSNWVQAGTDIDGELGNDGSGMAVALSSNGNRVAIGAWGNDGGGSSSGHVRVYDWNGSSWVKNIEDIDGETSNDNFGTSVALSSDGQTLASGAIHSDGDISDSGDVRVFDLTFETNLMAYYPFNGNASDESGYGNNGTVNGASLTTDRFGNSDSAFIFDGINDHIVCLQPGPTGTSPRTISFWAKTSLLPSVHSNVVLYYGGVSNSFNYGDRIEISLNSYNRYGLVLSLGGSVLIREFDNSDNNWHFYTLVFEGGPGKHLSDFKMYADGNLLTNTTYLTGNTYEVNTAENYPITIGNLTGYTRYFNGAIDDIKIYDLALTNDQIKAEYQNLIAYYPFNGNANDESVNLNHGTVYGATLTADKDGNANSAYSFDGVDNYIRVPHSNSLDITGNEITLSMWLYNDNPDTGNTWKGISKGGYDVNNGYELLFTNYPTANGKTSLNIGGGGYFTSSFNTYSNQWIMLTGTFNNGVGKVYINGVEQSYTTQGSTSLASSSSDLYIGTRNPANNYDGFVKGKIDDLRIYNKALSDTDVLNLYNNSSLGVEDKNINVLPHFYVYKNTLYLKDDINLKDVKYIEVYNILGQQVFKTSHIEKTVSLESLKTGLYILKIDFNSSGIQTKKFIIH